MIDVLSVASEAFPLIKTGGLADVTGALPAALAPHGVSMRTLLPAYPAVMQALSNVRELARLPDLYGDDARLLSGGAAGLELFVIDAPHLYGRPGNPYLGPDNRDWPDNWKRFAALSWVAGEIANGIAPDYRPQVVHAHDWQAGLAPAYVKYGPRDDVRTVLTVHNLAFQGQFGSEIFGQLRLPPHAFYESIEYFGGVGFLKAGLASADMLSTVSPTYAQEIKTTAYGMGLDGLLRARENELVGILNGIDMEAWDPEIDPALAHTYNASSLQNRAANRRALEERFALDGSSGALFGVVSRLTWQKGMDMLVAVCDRLVAAGGKLCILGSGDPEIENGLRGAAMRHPGRVGIITGYDETLSHLIQGGADVMLVPSRFEPCGLTQLYGLRYGCVPLVSRVGGLADTVIDANEAAIEAGVSTGIQFAPATEQALAEGIRRTIRLHATGKLWTKMQKRGMKSDVSWSASAAKYAALYARLLGMETNVDPAV
jgi:starch synthase